VLDKLQATLQQTLANYANTAQSTTSSLTT
jgi:hypothetical protein